MSQPSQKDFNDAICNPAAAFTDPDLAASDPVLGSNGRPQPHPGDSSDVYQLCGADDRIWAVKCFTKSLPALGARYARIQETLAPGAFPFAVECTFLKDGIRVNGSQHPLLKMEWVEGFLLNQVARERANSPAVMDNLFQRFVQLCRELRQAGIAHGDLQHGNAILVPGSWPGAYTLKLIDYDGMYLPTLSETPAGEVGHANYQHPSRASEQPYSADLDRFPLLVIGTALKALSVLGPPLWERYDTKDNLLFTAADFQNPAASPLMRELWQQKHPGLRKLVGKLALACRQPFAQTPWLDELAATLDAPLSAAETAAVAELLGSGEPAPIVSAASFTPLAEAFTLDDEPKPAPAPKPKPAPPRAQPLAPVVVHDLDDDPEEDAPPPRAKKRAKPQPEAAGTFPVVPVAIVVGLLLLGGGVAVGLVIAGQLKQPETAQPRSEGPPAPKPAPASTPAPQPQPQPPAPKPPEPPPVVLGPPRFEQVWAQPAGDELKGFRPFISPDGKTVFVATSQRIEVLDAKTGKPRVELRGAGMPTIPLNVWELDRDRVAVAGLPLRGVNVWNTKTGDPLPPLFAQDILPPPAPGLQSTAVECQLSPDSRFLFAGYQGQFRQPTHAPAPYRVTECATGKTVTQGDWTFGTVRFTADGSRMLMTETNGRVRWVKLPSGETEIEWAFQPNQFPRFISAISGDGSLFVYFGKPGRPFNPYLLDGKTGQVLRLLGAGFASERTVLTTDGKWLVGVVNDPTNLRQLAILVTDARTGEVLVRTPLDCGLNDIPRAAITPDGKSVVLHNRAKAEIALYELRGTAPPEATAQAPAPLGPIPPRATPGEVAVAPPPPQPPPLRPGLPPAAEIKARWKVATDTGPMSNGLPQAPLYAKDGKTVILSGGILGTILTFDPKTGAAGAVYEGHKGPGGVYWLLPFGDDRVVSGGFDGKQATWDTKTAKRVDDVKFAELPLLADGKRGHAGITYAISPNGRYTAIARKEAGRPVVAGPLRVLDTTTGKEVLKADWNGGRILFTVDESRVFILNGLGKANWYKLPSGEADGEWAAGAGVQAEFARVLGMTADGSKMIYLGPLAGEAGGVFLLDAKTGQVIRRLGGAPYQAAFSTLSPDGKYVAMGVIDSDGCGTWYLDVFEVENWRLVGRIAPPAKGAQGPPQFSFTPDSKELGVFYPTAKELSLFPVP